MSKYSNCMLFMIEEAKSLIILSLCYSGNMILYTKKLYKIKCRYLVFFLFFIIQYYRYVKSITTFTWSSVVLACVEETPNPKWQECYVF